MKRFKTIPFITRCLSFIFLLAAFQVLAADYAEACSCSSGCGMDTNGLSADVKQLLQQGLKEGRQPISCIRTQACQNRLRECYEKRCGQYGRAARKSAHSDGKACDYLPTHRVGLRKIKANLRLQNIQDLQHHRGHGGGMHVYTTRYTKSATQGPSPAAEASAPAARPNPPAPRAPASGGSGGGGGHQQLANGKYQCPRGLQSICGSTKDTPWCKSWVQSGNTPGCH